jgi:aspartyl-tRNA(Asn)/glutamyl-tRNA(Gln) amidotransferase subunit A
MSISEPNPNGEPSLIEAAVRLLTERAGLLLPIEEIRRLARSYELVCGLIARVHSPSRDHAVDLASNLPRSVEGRERRALVSAETAIPTIAKASLQLRTREVSAVALVEACLSRIAKLDGSVNSFLHVDAAGALAAAAAADADIASGRWRGPVHGVPVGIKDVIHVAGLPTTANSRLLAGFVAKQSATVIGRLEEAGAIIIGKNTLHEFAMGGPSFDLPWPPARNPWDLSRFTGGSSTGTAAAVAAGFVLGGVGTDTAGSIRIPAAHCGIAGLKPTYGRVGRGGVIPLAQTLDHVGPMAWTAEDCALMLTAMAGGSAGDATASAMAVPQYADGIGDGLDGLTIGVARHFFEDDNPVDADVSRGIAVALEALRDRGARVVDIRLSPMQDYSATGQVILLAEAFAIHQAHLKHRYDEFSRSLRDRVVPGAFVTGPDYVQAQRRRQELIDELGAAFERVDLLFTATMPTTAPVLEEVDSLYVFQRPLLTLPFDVTGSPALAVCCGFAGTGLPISVQVVGRAFDEATVLRAGHAIEVGTGSRSRRPSMLRGSSA